MKPRTNPCICVSCPDCENIFMAAMISITDYDTRREIEQYAKDGFTVDVRDAGEVKLYQKGCQTCNPTFAA